MITIKMDEEDFLDLLMNRVYDWTHGHGVEYDLFEKMYENAVYGGAFYEVTDGVNGIVDNDYVNYCDVIYSDDDRYEDILSSYEDDDYETKWGYIEAVDEYKGRPIFLIRNY